MHSTLMCDGSHSPLGEHRAPHVRQVEFDHYCGPYTQFFGVDRNAFGRGVTAHEHGLDISYSTVVRRKQAVKL